MNVRVMTKKPGLQRKSRIFAVPHQISVTNVMSSKEVYEMRFVARFPKASENIQGEGRRGVVKVFRSHKLVLL